MQKTTREWVDAIIASVIIEAGFVAYYWFLRGSYNLSVINKAAGATAAFLAALILIIGPLARMSNVFDRWAALRKHFGFIALAYGLIHGVLSLFFFPTRFTLAWYGTNWLPIAGGALAILLWIYLGLISNKKAMKAMGQLWRTHQSVFSQIAFAGILLHVAVLKWEDWTEWYTGAAKVMPYLAHPKTIPASLVVFLILGAVFIYRLVTMFTHKKK